MRFGLGQSAGHQGGGAQQGIQGATGNGRKNLENLCKICKTCMEHVWSFMGYQYLLAEHLWNIDGNWQRSMDNYVLIVAIHVFFGAGSA